MRTYANEFYAFAKLIVHNEVILFQRMNLLNLSQARSVWWQNLIWLNLSWAFIKSDDLTICCKKSRLAKDWMLKMSKSWRKKTLNKWLRRNSKKKRRQNDEKSIITWWKFEEWRKTRCIQKRLLLEKTKKLESSKSRRWKSRAFSFLRSSWSLLRISRSEVKKQ